MNWKLEDDAPEFVEAAERGLADYRAAVVERFGKVAEFSELVEGLDGLNEELGRWMERLNAS